MMRPISFSWAKRTTACWLVWSREVFSTFGPQRSVPPLPGATYTFATLFESARAETIACSRPPEPMTRTLTCSALMPASASATERPRSDIARKALAARSLLWLSETERAPSERTRSAIHCMSSLSTMTAICS